MTTTPTKNAAKKPAVRPRPRTGQADGERAVLAAIAAMPEPDRALGERLHRIIRASAPVLSPKTWYGMPAYAKGGRVVCFFRSGQRFKERYMTFGFNDGANLDAGGMWPTAFALRELTGADQARVQRAREEGRELMASTFVSPGDAISAIQAIAAACLDSPTTISGHSRRG
jgi:hypothetical protein